MRLQHEDPEAALERAAEPRYDAETLKKVTALAQELQSRHEQTFSAREKEATGAGGQALPGRSRALKSAWWGAAWTIPFVMTMLALTLKLGEAIEPLLFMLGMGSYVGVGVFLSHEAGSEAELEAPPVSRK